MKWDHIEPNRKHLRKKLDTNDLQVARNAQTDYVVKSTQTGDVVSYIYINRQGEPFAAWVLGPGISDIIIDPSIIEVAA